MLRKNVTPKDKSQQMISNNYQTIRYIVEHKDTPLSEKELLHIHRLMTENTLTNAEDAGRFRTNNDVVVEEKSLMRLYTCHHHTRRFLNL